MAYSDKVLDHYENPRNVGSFAKGADDVGTGMVGAPACGDVMKLQIKVGKDGVIEDAKFKTYGCGSAIASSSLVTEWVKGKTLDEAAAIRNTAIAEELALPPVKIHCSILAEDAIKAAVADYRAKHGRRAESGPPRRGSSRQRIERGPRIRDIEHVRREPRPGMAITLTESAAKHVASSLVKRGKGVGLRLGVRTSGCSGLAYKIEYADDIRPEDLSFQCHGVTVIVDPKSLQFLDGTELDFAREGLNEGFKFNNPNVKDACGCGESFNV